MPEYLSPGVYVEEIDLGTKPIEGVSTSTAGFVGVAERGPIAGVTRDTEGRPLGPFLVTSFAEYRRYFGGFVDVDAANRDRRWLPYAVDGFFSNGGKRAYIVRVANLPKPSDANPASQPAKFALGASVALPDRTIAPTTLLAATPAPSGSVTLADPGSFKAGDILAIDTGAKREITTILHFPQLRVARVQPPLQQTHDADVVVAPRERSPDLVRLNEGAGNPVNVKRVGGSDVIINANDFLAVADTAAPEMVQAAATVTISTAAAPLSLQEPVRFQHAVTTQFQKAAITTEVIRLAVPAREDADTLRVEHVTADVAVAADGWLQIDDGTDSEFVQVRTGVTVGATASDLQLKTPLRRRHALGIRLKKVTIGTEAVELTAQPLGTSITAVRLGGSNVVLRAGEVYIIDRGDRAELLQVGSDQTVTLSSTTVTLTAELKTGHANNTPIQRVIDVDSVLIPGGAALGDRQITVDDASGMLPPANGLPRTVLKIDTGRLTEYVSVTAVTGTTVSLAQPLSFQHGTNTAVQRLAAVAEVRARNEGAWGNRVRVSVAPSSRPVAQTKVAAEAAAGAPGILLQSAVGLEPGSLIELPDNLYARVTEVRGNEVRTALPVARTIPVDSAIQSVEFRVVVTLDSETEPYDNLSMDRLHRRYFPDFINRTSQLVEVQDLRAEADQIGVPPSNRPLVTDSPWALAGGSDGLAGITADPTVYVGEDNDDADRRTGLFALLNRTDISLVAIPGQTDATVQLAVITHAERARYRFAVLDPREGASLDQVQTQRRLFDTKYAALYYPWVKTFDPVEKKDNFVPPSGHVLGVYARTDVEVGVHKAPANAVLNQVRDLQATVTQGQHDILNPVHINAIRAFPGRGIRIWGARTLSSDPSWRYINVRRLFIFLEHSIDDATQYAVFEPNDVPLWERLRGSVTAFLTTQWRAGMLQGRSPEEAFFVKVGLGETMILDDIDNGRVIVLIGVAPVKPAEFVIFRITQSQPGAGAAA
jgi:phage tail sheath protein FI